MQVKIVSDDKKSAYKTIFDDTSTLLLLMERTEELLKIAPYEVDFTIGFPPKVLAGETANTLSSMGVKNGEAITLRRNPQKMTMYMKLVEIGYATELCLQAVNIEFTDLDLAIEVCEQLSRNNGNNVELQVGRKIIDADNSCLFTAISFLNNDITLSPHKYRRMVADAILSNPSAYYANMIDAEKSPEEYAQWILEPTKWGGEIEMSLLADQLATEIAAVDIQTKIMYIYGESKGYNKRIYLLYDGIHYDALVMSPTRYNKDNNKSTAAAVVLNDTMCQHATRMFNPSDQKVQQDMQQYANSLNEEKKFVNLSGCDLKCMVCNMGLIGQKGARDHAAVTGHTNFGQI